MISEDEDAPQESEPDDTPNAADPEQSKRHRKKAKFDSELIEEFWRKSLANPSGRLAIYNLLRDAGIFEVKIGTTPTGFPSVEKTFYHIGEQGFGWRLWRTLMRIDYEGVLHMMKERDLELADKKPKRRGIP